MSRWGWCLWLSMALTGARAQVAEPAAADPALEARMQHITAGRGDTLQRSDAYIIDRSHTHDTSRALTIASYSLIWAKVTSAIACGRS